MDEFPVSVPHCRTRQQRLLAEMRRHRLHLVLCPPIAPVHGLPGCPSSWLFSPLAALTAEGRCILAAPASRLPAMTAADDVVPYEGQWHSTLRNDQRIASAEMLLAA